MEGREGRTMRAFKPLNSLHRNSKGQATVELMLMTPLILFLFIIVVDFSLALRDWVMISNGVREGARLGALGGPYGPDDITDRVVATSDGIVQAGEVTVGYPDGGDRGDSVVVRTEHAYTFHFLSKIFPIDPTITLTTCADMRLEVAAADASGGISC